MRQLKVLMLLCIVLAVSCRQSHELLVDMPENIAAPPGMVWVNGATFTQGAKEGDNFAASQEKPAHSVTVDGFFIDITEVTNAQFTAFVNATGYITTAERPVDWEGMKTSLPPGTPKPADSLLLPGSLVFKDKLSSISNYHDYGQWWQWTPGASWKHPEGPESTIAGKENYPVVHISFDDALAYCKWANRRLPTEAEWELAAMGSFENTIYSWGNDKQQLHEKANTWQGRFPLSNTAEDGYATTSPVRSFAPNSVGLYDMAGNVWEYTSDWYNTKYYTALLKAGKPVINPKGAAEPYNPLNPYEKEKIIKGGSFLCHESYCSSYRISARMGMGVGSGASHIGFRTVATAAMLRSDN